MLMVVYVCCKLLFPMFQLFFHTFVASVFIRMLHVFHTYVACALSESCTYFTMIFSSVFRCFTSVSTIFERTLQMFYLNVFKVDRVLHLLRRFLLHRLVSPSLLDAGDVRTTWAHVGTGIVGGASRSGGVEPSRWAVWNRAGTGRGEQRLGAGLMPDVRALVAP
jgi:hypothetical protein